MPLQALEPVLRFVVFFGVFAVMAWAEARWPRRRLDHGRATRWPANLGIVVVDQIVARLLVPILPVALALHLEGSGSGLFGVMGVTRPASILLTLVILDGVIYLQHVLFHAVPHLWRLHRMHHADTDYDTSTALRFHPLEIVLSAFVKLAAVAALGAPAEGVILFEIVLNATAMFNHGNLRLPDRVDAAVRTVLVTPDMHRVHHSTRSDELHSNFGFALSIWDRLFGTYKAQPALGHERMQIGLPAFRAPEELRLGRMLTQPFRDPSDAPEGGEPMVGRKAA